MVKRLFVWLGSMLIASYVLLIRWTCRMDWHNDQRPALAAEGKTIIYSLLHAHQIGVMMKADPGTAAMVSRSLDGQLIVPALKALRCVAIRGSKWRPWERKGGREAIDELTQHSLNGGPVAIAVDGPRGPRGKAHKGVAALSQATGAAVLNVVAIPSHRIVLRRTWDFMQIPLPFSTIKGCFADPIYPIAGEKLEAYRQRIELHLRALEAKFDPEMAALNQPVASVASDDTSSASPRQAA